MRKTTVSKYKNIKVMMIYSLYKILFVNHVKAWLISSTDHGRD